jgi:hypothetical protein
VAPEESRRAIASWLASQGIVRSSDNDTKLRPTVVPATAARRDLRWAWVAAAAGGVLLITLMTMPDRPAPAPANAAVPVARPKEAPPVVRPAAEFAGLAFRSSPIDEPVAAPVSLQPAELRVVATPWAKITVDDEVTFYTPRAAPVELEPGPHRVVFEHPAHGRHVVELDLEPGQTFTLRHAFEGASS